LPFALDACDPAVHLGGLEQLGVALCCAAHGSREFGAVLDGVLVNRAWHRRSPLARRRAISDSHALDPLGVLYDMAQRPRPGLKFMSVPFVVSFQSPDVAFRTLMRAQD
jgi:hypothetical protein